MKYIAPDLTKTAFTCPHCHAISRQNRNISDKILSGHSSSLDNRLPIRTMLCDNCREVSLWYLDKMVYPENPNGLSPNEDMPDDIKALYLEASSISSKSPRGAAALLRLAIQKLCIELGCKGKNISDDISALVKNGLSPTIQKSLDIVRVIGNDAVHPGQIDVDDIETVSTLFHLVNIITETMISNPKKVASLYEALPQDKREAIANRDK